MAKEGVGDDVLWQPGRLQERVHRSRPAVGQEEGRDLAGRGAVAEMLRRLGGRGRS